MARMRNPLIFLSGLLFLAIPACGDDGMGEDGSTTNNPTNAMTDPTNAMTDPTGGGGELTCDAYCTSITANCTGGNLQYFDNMDGGMGACMAACTAFPVGTMADTSMNTLGCRTYHAGAAAMDAALHCPHAGPGGAGACGANCEGFCKIAMSSCSSVYADETACMNECAMFDDTTPYNATVTTGNSLACRLYHLTAATLVPDPHCTHINAASPTCM